MSRWVKQFVYGIFYLIILGILVSLIYLYFVKQRPSCDDGIVNQNEEGADCGGVCVPCVFKNLQKLEVFPVNIFDNDNQTTSILIELFNKNRELGVKSLPYTVNLYDKNNSKVFSLSKEIQIKPDARQVIVEAGLAVDPALVARGELVLEEPKWEITPKQPPMLLVDPNFQIKTEGNRVILLSRGINNNPFSISEAEIQVLLLNQLGLYVSASKTILRNIASDSVTDFQVNFIVQPDTLAAIDFSKTRVVVEVRK